MALELKTAPPVPNKVALFHYLKTSRMEAQIYGADPLPAALEEAILDELCKENPRSLDEIRAPFTEALANRYRGCAD